MTRDHITTMDDPQFLAERRRVREELDRLLPHQDREYLSARYQTLNDEFTRRARIAWAQADWGGIRERRSRDKYAA